MAMVSDDGLPADGDVHEAQVRLLRALIEAGGETDGPDMRSRAGVGGDTGRYHIDASRNENDLVGLGLVRRQPHTVDVGSAIEANVYRITDRGRRVAEARGDRPTYDELRAEVTALRDRVAEARDDRDDLRDQVEELRADFGRLLDHLDDE